MSLISHNPAAAVRTAEFVLKSATEQLKSARVHRTAVFIASSEFGGTYLRAALDAADALINAADDAVIEAHLSLRQISALCTGTPVWALA